MASATPSVLSTITLVRALAALAKAIVTARKASSLRPEGKYDSARRWEPSDAEWQTCCRSIRSPTRTWPWSLLKHAHTRTHADGLVRAWLDGHSVPASVAALLGNYQSILGPVAAPIAARTGHDPAVVADAIRAALAAQYGKVA